MMIFGYFGVVHQPGSPWWEIVTVFFAIGMGLALDEFALWVELKDVYWSRGRPQVDRRDDPRRLPRGRAVVGFSSWVTLADSVEDAVFFGRRGLRLVGIVVGMVNAAKEKLWWALASLIFWPGGNRARAPTGQAAVAVGAALLRRWPGDEEASARYGAAGVRRRLGAAFGGGDLAAS